MTDHVTAWLAAYHDGELTGRRVRKVEAHLAARLGAAPRRPLRSALGLSRDPGESARRHVVGGQSPHPVGPRAR